MTKFKTGLLVAVANLPLLAMPAFAQTSVVATLDSARALFQVPVIATALQQIQTKYAADLKKADDRSTLARTNTAAAVAALDVNKDGDMDSNEYEVAAKANRPEAKRIADEERAVFTDNSATLRNYTNSQLYVFDQVRVRYSAALDAQVSSKRIGLVLAANPNMVIRQAAGTDLTDVIQAAVNKPLAIDAPATFNANDDTRALARTYFQLAEQQAQARQQQQAQQGAQQAPQAGTPAPTTRPPAKPATKTDRNGDPIK